MSKAARGPYAAPPFALVVLLLTAFTPSPAAGYEGAGHYYSLSLVVKKALPQLPEAESSLVALCTQLPDIAEELDAVDVYFALARSHPIDFFWWGCCDTTDPDHVRQMMAVHQLLHALTGGTAGEVELVAREIVTTLAQRITWIAQRPGQSVDSSALCALGLGLHFAGDAFAHRQLKAAGSMYPTGRGHATDLSLPDYPLYEPDDDSHVRSETWKGFILSAVAFLGTYRLDPTVATQEVARVLYLPRSNTRLTRRNKYGEDLITQILIKRIQPRLEQFDSAPNMHPHMKCQDYLAEIFGKKAADGQQMHFRGLAVPQCRDVWTAFRTAAVEAFRKHPDALDKRWTKVKLDWVDPKF